MSSVGYSLVCMYILSCCTCTGLPYMLEIALGLPLIIANSDLVCYIDNYSKFRPGLLY